MKNYSLKVISPYEHIETNSINVDQDMTIYQYIDNGYKHEKYIVRNGAKLIIETRLNATDQQLDHRCLDIYHNVILQSPGAQVIINTKGCAANGNKIIYRSNIETIDETMPHLNGEENINLLLLDDMSEIDAIPSISINKNSVNLAHRLRIARIDQQSSYYLAVHGLDNEEIDNIYASSMLK